MEDITTDSDSVSSENSDSNADVGGVASSVVSGGEVLDSENSSSQNPSSDSASADGSSLNTSSVDNSINEDEGDSTPSESTSSIDMADSASVMPEDTAVQDSVIEDTAQAAITGAAAMTGVNSLAGAVNVGSSEESSKSGVDSVVEHSVVEQGGVEETQEPAGQEAADQETVEPEVAEDVNPNLEWYVIQAYSGYELKVKRALQDRIRNSGVEHQFGEIRVPEETVVELVKGQKKTSTRKFFPGYVLVQMELNQDTWHVIKETPKVSGFVGDATNPQPLSPEEVGNILQQVEEGAASPKAKLNFEEGETIKVVDGPFTDFSGTVEEVKPEKGKLKVLISIFGRATPVELDFVQVQKT